MPHLYRMSIGVYKNNKGYALFSRLTYEWCNGPLSLNMDGKPSGENGYVLDKHVKTDLIVRHTVNSVVQIIWKLSNKWTCFWWKIMLFSNLTFQPVSAMCFDDVSTTFQISRIKYSNYHWVLYISILTLTLAP